MVLAKDRNKVGLGNSLMNDRFGKNKKTAQHRVSAGITRVAPDGTEYKINEKAEASWVKMRSVTEQGDLDEFLANAELAGTDFTAEKLTGTKIIHADQKNPYLLSMREERAVSRRQNENKGRLTVPRRPPWDSKTTPQELDERERESLIQWRRGLAELEENKDLLMTPFERNIEVWRQLWRVIERSDLVVQIVDARNPLLYRSEDLERYVKEVDSKKENLLLVNKADLMTLEQREAWAQYFEKEGIKYKFFSAQLAKESLEVPSGDEDEEHVPSMPPKVQESAVNKIVKKTRKLAVHPKQNDDSDDDEEEEEDDDDDDEESSNNSDEEEWTEDEEDLESQTQRTRIMTIEELEDLFLANAPEVENPEDPDAPPRKSQIGLVGYPNVGKSSTINALCGAKKVSVSSTPGKTKHFQTIHLSEQVILCDCPGLVLPNFASTKAELVCNGILPIDQQREFIGPTGLVARRIPKVFFESLYGVKINARPIEEGGTGVPTAEEILRAYAKGRGFTAQGKSGWDISRAARYILKDYVNGKLLWCAPPPREPAWDEREFNRRLYDRAHLPLKRRMQIAAQEAAAAESAADGTGVVDASLVDFQGEVPGQGPKSKRLDSTFFKPGQSTAGHLNMPFNYKYTEQGKLLSGRKAKTMVALEKGIDPSDLKMSSKKHFKGNKRGKHRSNAGADD